MNILFTIKDMVDLDNESTIHKCIETESLHRQICNNISSYKSMCKSFLEVLERNPDMNKLMEMLYKRIGEYNFAREVAELKSKIKELKSLNFKINDCDVYIPVIENKITPENVEATLKQMSEIKIYYSS